MKPKNVIFTLFLALALLAIFIKQMVHEPRAKEAFDRSPVSLQYTKHALCRMDCRQVSKEDIDEIIERGIINLSKSDRNDKPCPTYAVQGTTSDGESLRVIFAQCDKATKVVTCYNLKQDFECHCPGDEKGGRN
ncbi:MAG: hypothetical protein JWP69_875 [Flaviaesturariibacter sp.]|nr:hypothetical protein [Flaviaesturariibacter sp.]